MHPRSRNLWVGGFFCPFKKINSEDTTMPLKGGKYACVKGLLYLFFLLKQFKYEIILGFQ